MTRRHHIDQSVVNKAIKAAVRKVGINKRVSAHTFRHGFATHLFAARHRYSNDSGAARPP
ncbi:MAG: tyrosine-type recombinase/integrase [Chromatiaceae bacterium]